MPSLAALRQDYTRSGLTETELAPTWHAQLERWMADAAELREPNAVVLATADATGVPSARTVLLKAYDERGLVVYTNYTSRKGREAATNPHAALVFPWLDLERQVTVAGRVERVSRAETEAYFRTRPRASQIGAHVSRQSMVIPDRAMLDAREAELTARFAGGEVPVPDDWGGLRLVPERVEFWQGRTSRLHDRLQFRRSADGWLVERLSP